MDLKDDPVLIAKYVEAHSKYKSWPEIREGIRSIGILEMEIYIKKNRLFMIVETPLDFDWDSAMENWQNCLNRLNGKLTLPYFKTVNQAVPQHRSGI